MKITVSVLLGALLFMIYASIWYLSAMIPVNLVTSGVKSISNQCGTEYRLEKLPLVTGNWFCPEEKSND